MTLKVKKTALLRIITWFLLFHPIIDVFTSFAVRLGFNITLGIILRALFVALLIVYFVFISSYRQKRYILLYFWFAVAYLAVFLALGLFSNGIAHTIFNAKETFKVFYFIFVLIGLYSVYREHGFLVDDKTLSTALNIYFAVIIVAFVTGSSFPAYTFGYGYVGWFYAANELGAIVSVLTPVCLVLILKNLLAAAKGKKWFQAALMLLSVAAVVFCSSFIGTKLVFAAVLAYVALALIWLLFRMAITKKRIYAGRILVVIFMFSGILGLYNVSPLKANLTHTLIPKYEDTKKPAPDPEPTDPGDIPSPDDESGFMKTINWLLSGRIDHVYPVDRAYRTAPLSRQLFGIGYTNGNTSLAKSIELDFVSIFYRHGIIGFILYMIPLLYAIVNILVYFFRHIGQCLKSAEHMTYLYCLALGLAMAFFTGHVIVAPAVSIYIAIFLVKLLDFNCSSRRAFIDNGDVICH